MGITVKMVMRMKMKVGVGGEMRVGVRMGMRVGMGNGWWAMNVSHILLGWAGPDPAGADERFER